MIMTGVKNFRFIFISVLLTFGFSPVWCSKCKASEAGLCISNYVYFDSATLPFFGGNEKELIDTCKCMDSTTDCMANFYNECNGKDYCDAECEKKMKVLDTLKTAGTLGKLFAQLCVPESELWKGYLEVAKCLKEAEPHFDICRSFAEISSKEVNPGNKCCYITWYHGCFIRAPENAGCDPRATEVVSQIMSLLMIDSCSDYTPCDVPPLPPDVVYIEHTNATSSSEKADAKFTGCEDLYAMKTGKVEMKDKIITVKGSSKGDCTRYSGVLLLLGLAVLSIFAVRRES